MALGAIRGLFYILVLALFLAGAVYVWGYNQFTAAGPSPREITLVLPRGSGLTQIARKLRQNNVIANDLVFRAAVQLEKTARRLKAGEYIFPARVSMRQAMQIIIDGKTVVRKLTIPEGLSSAEILRQLAKVGGLVGKIPKALPEGSLLPETYHFSFGDKRAMIVRRMSANMEKVASELWRTRQENLPLASIDQLIVLASIIEKETGIGSERARVAGVFVNRLRKGMKLQSDPTVTYGITFGRKALRRPLNRKDLARASAYNTYVIPALPPGPIANPGLDALRAAAQPLATKELYFVADGSGGHAFARTLKEHNRNVRKWRKLQRRQGRRRKSK